MAKDAGSQFGELIEHLSNNQFKGESKTMRVKRGGKQIILPDGMSVQAGIFHLLRLLEYEEKEVKVHHRIPCYPLDGAVALTRVVQRHFGFSTAEAEPGFFGDKPPVLLSVPTGVGEVEQVIWGRISPPVLEGGFLQPQADQNPRSPALIISGLVKRKFDADIKELAQLVEKELQEHSIYRGKAFSLKMDYLKRNMEEEGGFDPLADGPKYLDTSLIHDDEMVISSSMEADLATSVWQRIERTEWCRRSGIPLRHRILLTGPYGVGKSSVLRITSAKAVRNGWSFIYLPNAEDLAEAIPTIKLMMPAVVAVEDVDKITGDGDDHRTEEINKLMNVLSGIGDKDDALILMMTTNRPDKIQEGFMRPGRTDTMIHLTYPTTEMNVALIQKYLKDDNGQSLLAPNTSLDRLAGEMAKLEFVPAFLEETCRKAVLWAGYKKNKENLVGEVELHHLEASFEANKRHLEVMRSRANQTKTRSLPEEFVSHLVDRVAEKVDEIN